MNEWVVVAIAAVIALAGGFGLGFVIRRYAVQDSIKQQQQQAEHLLGKAEKEASEIALTAKDEALKIRSTAEKELDRRRAGLRREEERMQRRREKLDHRQERFEQREQSLSKRQSALDKRRNEVERLRQEQAETLQRVAGLSREEAKQELLAIVEVESRQDMARVIRQVETEAKEEADARARKIITYAIQRMASEEVAELTVSSVLLPSDDMKGRIIGRGGRNIRAFEQAAGVDVVVDDTPEAVTISCFDPVRREIARRSMERLVVDGRIHPARIEKVIEDSQKDASSAKRASERSTRLACLGCTARS